MSKNLQYVDIEIDKLTNSLENIITGDSFPTDIVLANSNDLKTITKNEGWLFDWKTEFKKPERDVYKLQLSTINL
jgi:ribonucleotide monophosphatase NagD (HAD superfamily)